MNLASFSQLFAKSPAPVKRQARAAEVVVPAALTGDRVYAGGSYTGDIECETVTLMPDAVFDGSINALFVELAGEFRGSLRCESLTVKDGARVSGVVHCKKVDVSIGASMDCYIHLLQGAIKQRPAAREPRALPKPADAAPEPDPEPEIVTTAIVTAPPVQQARSAPQPRSIPATAFPEYSDGLEPEPEPRAPEPVAPPPAVSVAATAPSPKPSQPSEENDLLKLLNDVPSTVKRFGGFGGPPSGR